MVTLSLLLLAGILYVLFSQNGTQTLRENFSAPLTIMVEDESATAAAHNDSDHAADADDHADEDHHAKKSWLPKTIGLGTALFFGFAVALLGISGFESSANFVEEQEPGVFPKTLRNMWMAVSFFNPMMAFLALALIPMVTIQTDPDYELKLLSKMGEVAGGPWFGTPLSVLIRIDAVLVLSGAVLTSFVGVNGLIHRMTLDRCLPQFLLKTNSRGTTHRILIMFFLLSASVLLITQGSIPALAGVYTISFLTVMALFAVGNILLKVMRNKLPRPVRASWASVIIAIAAVLVGLAGNAIKEPEYLIVFLCYFIPSMAFISVMLYRIPLMRVVLSMVRGAASGLVTPLNNTARFVRNWIDEINSQQVVFFTRGDNISNLNNAMLYVAGNEDTNNIKVVTVVNDKADVPKKLEQDLQFLDEAYPDIDIEFVSMVDTFGPELINRLSKEWNIPTNLMFIGSPSGKLVHGLEELGGVRLII
jgi:amino acid transporter